MNQIKNMLILFCLISVVPVCGQRKSDAIVPKWINNPPVSKNRNVEFRSVYIDNGTNLSDSRTLIKAELINSIQREDKITLEESSETSSTDTQANGQSMEHRSVSSYSLKVKSEGAPVYVNCEKVDEYWIEEVVGGRHSFKYYALFAVQKNSKMKSSEQYSITTSYGVRGLWRSAILPGWGQMYKGSVVKGISLLSAEVVCVAGIIVTESLRANYMQLAKGTHNSTHQKTYLLNADNCSTFRNVAIGATAAVYLYNLIDAVAAKGAKRVDLHSSVRVIPFGDLNHAGISLSYNF